MTIEMITQNKTCPACNVGMCRAAVRLSTSWIELCGSCAERAQRRGLAAFVVREPSAMLAFDAALARGVTPADALEIARQVDDAIRTTAIRQLAAEGLLDPEGILA